MKLSGWVWIVLGLCLGLSALAFVFIQIYMPYEQAVGYNNTYRDQLTAQANKQRAAEQRVQTAMDLVNQKAQEWNAVVLTKTPPSSLASGGINFNVNAYQLAVDAVKYRNNVQRAVNYQSKRGGVKVISLPSVPEPPEDPAELVANYFNYQNFGFPVVYYELSPIVVEGTYEQIKANVKAWSSMPRYLAVADGLTIAGTSPKLTGTYNVVILGYLQGSQMHPAPLTGTGAVNTPANAPGPASPKGGLGRG